MTPTTKIDPVIEDLRARIVALESDRCECASCMGRRSRMREGERLARLAAVAALPEDARTPALLDLAPMERREALMAMGSDAAIAFVAALPDDAQRRAHREDLRAPLRDRAELLEYQLPPHFELAAAPGRVLSAARSFTLAPDLAGRARAVGLKHLRIDELRNLYSFRRQYSFSAGARLILDGAQLEVLRLVDEDVEAFVLAGHVTVREVSEDEAREHVLRVWAEGEHEKRLSLARLRLRTPLERGDARADDGSRNAPTRKGSSS